MKDLNMVFAGFGGQGVLFAGKVAAYAGLLENKEISRFGSLTEVFDGFSVFAAPLVCKGRDAQFILGKRV